MKRKNLATPFFLLLALLFVIVIVAVWFVRPYIPQKGGATAHFETPPPSDDSRWTRVSLARPPVPRSNNPITPQNTTRLTETARWGGGTPRSLTYSPDGSMIAVLTALGPYLYDTQSLELVRWIEPHRDIQAATFSPDSTILALALEDHTIQLRSVANGALLRTLEGHTSYIQQLSYDSTGQHLASASWDNTARIWSVSDGTVVQTIKGHNDDVQSVALHPEGTMVATASSDGTVRLWRIEDGAELRSTGKPFLLSIDHTIGDISAGGYFYHWVAYSPDGSKLAASDSSGYTYIWEVPGGRLVHAINHKALQTRLLPLAFASNTTLLTSSAEQWDFTQGKVPHDFDEAIFEPRFAMPSPNGEEVAAIDWEGGLGIWNLSDGAFVKGLRRGEASTPSHQSITVAPNGNLLFLGDDDGNVQIRQLPDGELLHTLPHSDMPVEHLAVSPDGAFLAVGSEYTYLSEIEDQGVVRVWRVADGTLLYELSGHQSIYDLAFSLDSSVLVTAGSDENYEYPIRLWNMANGSLVHELRGHDSYVDQVRFTDGGSHLLSASSDDAIQEWDIATGDAIQTTTGIRYNNHPLFSADGTLFASRIADNIVSIRSPNNDAPTSTLEHDDFSVWALAFNPDGSLLVTGTSAGNLYLWRVEDGTLLQKIPAHTDILTTLAFSDDGTTLISAGWDDTLRFWQIQDP